jgi:hypothetical protein
MQKKGLGCPNRYQSQPVKPYVVCRRNGYAESSPKPVECFQQHYMELRQFRHSQRKSVRRSYLYCNRDYYNNGKNRK